jgi:multisubunit Na+/H+ antiporter MnhB subunit
MKHLLASRLSLLFVLPNGLFLLGSITLGSEAMIGILNAAIVALAAGVCVAYATTTRDIVLGRLPLNKVHWLALGIFLSWAGTQLTRWWSIIWRWLDMPAWFANSWIVSYGLFLVACGAYFHLIADEAIGEERVPPRRWIRWGVVVAVAVFVMVATSYAIDRWTEAGSFYGPGLG